MQCAEQPDFGDQASELLAGYRKHHPDYAAGDLLVRIMSATMRVGAIELAEAHVKAGGAPTYMYLVNWESTILDNRARLDGALAPSLITDRCKGDRRRRRFRCP